MKVIRLVSGDHEALVDASDYPWLSMHRWYATTNPRSESVYATTKIKGKNVKMHRLLLHPASHVHIDHINGQTLDNRRSNLRPATPTENGRNSTKRIIGASAYKGVSPCRSKMNSWRSYIVVGGRQIHLGVFGSELEAAEAYDIAASMLFGEFARTNKGTNMDRALEKTVSEAIRLSQNGVSRRVKLSEADRDLILTLCNKTSGKELARRFSVSEALISKITTANRK